MIDQGNSTMRFIVTLFILLLSTAAVGETRYVNDELIINLRTGQGNTYRILRTLPSGTPLEILEENEQYIYVRTRDGIEGWVGSQYLVNTPIARDRLVQAEKRLSQLQAEKQQLQQALSELKQEKGSVEKEQRTLSAETENLSQELERLRKVAARPFELDRENSELKQHLRSLQNEINQLTSDNSRLQDSSQRDWFLTGGGVLFGGILLGLILPMLRRKKKSGMFD
jgi:SH3 domain protein